MRIGVDTGGTFTDVVADDGRITKVPSTPTDPGEAVRTGAGALLPDGEDRPRSLAHGTTVATNALLERRGGRVALVTNEGFADIIEIARQDRPSLYDPWADRPEPLVARADRLEVPGRIGPDGIEVAPIDPVVVPDVPVGADAVAVCFLHSDLNVEHEVAVRDELRRRGHEVTASFEVSPEFREYERTVTTVVNAYLLPTCRAYLEALADVADQVGIMTSAGGLTDLATASRFPVGLLLSGPAGGVLAGSAAAAASGYPDAVTFDMGGTSTDVCLVQGGVPEPAGERSVAGFPIRRPSLDVHTIGAGGGSIARIDPGGALQVGPRSAGAVPGPACYGHGGTEPTVTDADLVAGHLPEGVELPGIGELDRAAAEAALGRAGVTADDVITVVDAAMEEAVRAVSVARGVDPAGLALVAFGGAGPLHAVAVAEALGMAAVVIPARAGVLSAVGCLAAPVQADAVRSLPAGTGIAQARIAARALVDAVRESAPASLDPDVEGARILADDDQDPCTASFDCRYQGQSHEIRVFDPEDFPAAHEQRNGYVRPGTPVEVVAVRVSSKTPSPVEIEDLPPVERTGVVGPTVIAEDDCTIWVPAGWRADVHPVSSAFVITRIEP